MHWESAQRDRLENTQQIRVSDSNPVTKQSIYRTGYYNENIYQRFPDFFFYRRPFLASKDNNESSHPCSRNYRVPELIGIQNYIYIYISGRFLDS